MQKINKEASDKIDSFRTEIREKHRNEIKKSLRRKHMQSDELEDFPLYSQTLEKFHHLSHHEISKHIHLITEEIELGSLYLDMHMENENENENNENEQSLLVQDIFYLLFEQPEFKFPRKLKFIHNGCSLTASLIALVCYSTEPKELAYWIKYMNDEDLEIVYLSIISDPEAKESRFYYQSWVNQPELRNYILEHFLYIKSASKALREIIGFKAVHPNRIINNRGETACEILSDLFLKEIEGTLTKETNCSENSTNSEYSERLFPEHLEIATKVIAARSLENSENDNNCKELIDLLSKIVVEKIEKNSNLISPLFFLWTIDALLVHKVYTLSKEAYEILISVLEYDPKFTYYKCEENEQKIILNEEKIKKFTEEVRKRYS